MARFRRVRRRSFRRGRRRSFSRGRIKTRRGRRAKRTFVNMSRGGIRL